MAINKNKVMEVAQKLVEKGQTDKAIKEYLKIVVEDPNDVRIWLKIGDLYAKRGAKPEAVETYLKVAEHYSSQGFFLKAVAVYKQILKIDNRLIDINMRLAEVYRQLGLMSDSLQQFEMVAGLYLREGKLDEAIKTIKQLIDIDPENVANRIKLAELYSKEQMTKEAIAEFARAADFLREKNRAEDFVKVAERLVWHQPDNLDVCRELATIYLKRRDPRHALPKLQVCFKADPRNVLTLQLLAQAFLALDQRSKTVSVWKELARIYTENGDRAQSLEHWRKVLSLTPDDAEAQSAVGHSGAAAGSLGHVPAASGMRPEPAHAAPKAAPAPAAKPAPRPAAPAPQKPVPAPTELEFDAEPLDDDDAVILEADEGSETHSEEISKILTETEVYAKYGLYAKALDHVRRVFNLDPANLAAHRKLKEIHLATGSVSDAIAELITLAELVAPSDLEAAGRYLEEILTIDPEDVEAPALAERYGIVLAAPAAALVPRKPAAVLASVEEEVDLDGLGEPLEADVIDEPGMEFEFDRFTPGDKAEKAARPAAPEPGSFDRTPPVGTSAEDDWGGVGLADELEAGVEPLPGEQTFDIPLAEIAAIANQEIASDDGSGGLADALEEEVPDTAAGAGEAAPEGGATLEDDLEEADFYISQGLVEDARPLIDALYERFPDHPLVLAKLQELEALEAAASAEGSDGAGEWSAEGEEGEAAAEPVPEPEIVAETAPEDAGPAPLSDADAQEKCDLAVAYREMGLFDKAMQELALVRGTPGREFSVHQLTGLCLASQGKFHDAISEFKAGLHIEGLADEQCFDLYYEIGGAYEALRDASEAVFYFEKVAKRDPKFRGVAKRLEPLKKAAAEKAGGNGKGTR